MCCVAEEEEKEENQDPQKYRRSKERKKMDRRTSAVPMDFEWQSGRGPVDERSPFHTFAVAKDREREKEREIGYGQVQGQGQGQHGKKRELGFFALFDGVLEVLEVMRVEG